MAYIIDLSILLIVGMTIWGLPTLLLRAFTNIRLETIPLLSITLGAVTNLAWVYFTLLEGIWSASVGKALLNLRVIRVDGRPPGLVRAFGRVSAALALILLPALLPIELVLSGVLLLLLLVLVLATMRKKNGFACAWDQLTATRVVEAQDYVVRRRQQVHHGDQSRTRSRRSIETYSIVAEVIPERWLTAVGSVKRNLFKVCSIC